VNPPCNRKSRTGNPHLQRGALDLYPNRRRHSKPDSRHRPTRQSSRKPVLDPKNIAVCARNNRSPWPLYGARGLHPPSPEPTRNEHAHASSPPNRPAHRRAERSQHFSVRRFSLAIASRGGVFKRTSDLVITSFALIFFLPIFGLVAVTIAVFDDIPVLYRHSRVGYGRRPFLCLKFRMLIANGDKILKRHLQSSLPAAREWAESLKLQNDPRITVVGGVLRKLAEHRAIQHTASDGAAHHMSASSPALSGTG
jgi:Bacterial sugar transferase